MTLNQAHEEIDRMLSETQEAVGGKWEVHDDTRPRSCTTAEGGDGLQIAFLRSAKPGVADEAVRSKYFTLLHETWSSNGYKVEEPTTEDIGVELYQMLANNGNGSALAFSLNETAMTIDGGSSCVPGTYSEYQEELEKDGF